MTSTGSTVAGQADLLVSCGDVTDQVIHDAARAYGCKAVFAVKGNHDPGTPFIGPIVDLHLKVREQDGLRFGGLGEA
jgi:predicted phosphodiesterase